MESDKTTNKRHSDEVIEIVKNMTLFDDMLMSKVFEKNIKATELVLRIILGRDIHVMTVEAQHKLQAHPVEARSITLDIYAIDEDGKEIDIEVQSDPRGSSVKRARFHSSMMDSHMLQAGQGFDELKDSYVIFIYKHDKFGKGLPIYKIDRCILGLGEPINDGSHIIYVNGAYKGNDDIGKLIADFHQSDTSKMNYKELRESTEHFKTLQKGDDAMSEAVENYANKLVEREKKEIAYNLKNKGITIDQIAEIINCQIDLVKSWLTPSAT